MQINIMSVAKIKEKYLLEGIKEYAKRLSKFVELHFIELKDEPIKDDAGPSEIFKIKEVEEKRILKAIPERSYVIALDLKGKLVTSEELAEKFLEIQNYFSSKITFIIGGSLGLSDKVISIANYRLCLSKMTFPHQLAKFILLEQIYRSFKINNNETYHK